MKKEQFLTSANLGSLTNAAIILLQGTKAASQVMATGATGMPDDTAMQNVQMYYDEGGTVFGTAGRLHCWYTGWRTKEYTPLDRATGCYAYSDNLGVSWTKPTLNLVSVNGSTAHNGFRSGQVQVTVNPADAYPVQALVNFAGAAEYEWRHARGTTPTGLTENGTTICRTNADGWSTFYDRVNDRYLHFYQIFFSDDGDFDTSANIDQFQRLFCLDYAATLDGAWHYGSPANTTAKTVKTQGENKTASDNSNITAQHETYMGAGLLAATDIAGTNYVMFSPNMFTRSPSNDFRQGTFVPGLAIMSDLTAEAFTRVRGNTADSILALGTATTWDDSMISMATGLIETATEWIGHYFAWDIDHREFYPIINGGIISDHDVQVGRAVWRKDGMTALEFSGAGSFVSPTVTKQAGDKFWANYNGTITLELLDATTSAVLDGYASADCDLVAGDYIDQQVTWNGDGALPLTSFKVKVYGATGTRIYSYGVGLSESGQSYAGTVNGLTYSANGTGPKINGYRFDLVAENDPAASTIRIVRGGVKYRFRKVVE